MRRYGALADRDARPPAGEVGTAVCTALVRGGSVEEEVSCASVKSQVCRERLIRDCVPIVELRQLRGHGSEFGRSKCADEQSVVKHPLVQLGIEADRQHGISLGHVVREGVPIDLPGIAGQSPAVEGPTGVAPADRADEPFVRDGHLLPTQPCGEPRVPPELGVALVHIEIVGASVRQRVQLRTPSTGILELDINADPVQQAGPDTTTDPRKGCEVRVHASGPAVRLAAKAKLTVEAEHGKLFRFLRQERFRRSKKEQTQGRDCCGRYAVTSRAD